MVKLSGAWSLTGICGPGCQCDAWPKRPSSSKIAHRYSFERMLAVVMSGSWRPLWTNRPGALSPAGSNHAGAIVMCTAYVAATSTSRSAAAFTRRP